MKIMGKRAGVLAGVYFFSQCLFAYQPEHGFWAQRRRAARDQRGVVLASVPGNGAVGSLAAQFPAAQSVTPSLSRALARSVPAPFLNDHGDLLNALSTGHGSIRKISLPLKKTDRSPVVVHIQDVHMNQEAQWNIRETVHGLLRSGRVDLVGLEGATNEIDLQPFVDFPSRRAVAASADYVLKQNKITGPVHAAMTAEGKLPRFVGVDDPVHYPANVQAYRDAEPLLARGRKQAEERLQQLDHEKTEACSPELRAFDDVVRSFEDQQVSLGGYVLELAARARSVPIDVERFAQALALERTLDFQRVEKERAALVGILTQRLNRDETNTLLANSVAYRGGQMGYGTFYEQLQTLCRKKNVPLAQFPALDAYVRYVLLADGIDAERLYKELARLEKSTYRLLAKTPQEKAWMVRCQEARLLRKLVNFSMTPADWKEYESLASRPDWAPFEAFYKEAHVRDGAMADNLLKALGAGHGTTALLVTGGYHAEGIAKRLTAQGVTVLSYVPKIEKIDIAQGSAYLSVFSQEKTPLEKLFAGEKLFLGFDPGSGIQEAGVLCRTVSEIENNNLISPERFTKLETFLKKLVGPKTNLIIEKISKNRNVWTAGVVIRNGHQSVRYQLTANEKLEILSFQLVDQEIPPPHSWFLELIVIPIQQWLGRWAPKIAHLTETWVTYGIDRWIPAHYLYFLRRHHYDTPEELVERVVWAGAHSFRALTNKDKPLSLFKTSGFHKIWNVELKLPPMAASKNPYGWLSWVNFFLYPNRLFKEFKKARDLKKNPTPGRVPRGGKIGDRELVSATPEEEYLIRNGQLDGLVVRILLVRPNGDYFVLDKKVKDKNAGPGLLLPPLQIDTVGGGVPEKPGESLEEGILREIEQETGLNDRSIQDQIGNQTRLEYRFIPPSRQTKVGKAGSSPTRRPTCFFKVHITDELAKKVKISSEHVGSRWNPLPAILNDFPKLGTGPKMQFYLEFLDLAYGITGVKSLIPLSDNFRLKRLNDPVLIETDEGWFLFHIRGDEKTVERMNRAIPGSTFKIVGYKKRSRGKDSLSSSWKNPTGKLTYKNGRSISKPFVMSRLELVGSSTNSGDSGSEEIIGVSAITPSSTIKGGGLKTRLLDSIPYGVESLLSVRILVKLDVEKEVMYLLLKNKKHKDECPGGGVENEDFHLDKIIMLKNAAARELSQELGWEIRPEQITVSADPLLHHSITRPDGRVEYRTVYHVALLLNDVQEIKINDESIGSNWVSLNSMMNQYSGLTLASRKVTLKEIVKEKYGLDVVFFRPMPEAGEGEFPLVIRTNDGEEYVLRMLDIEGTNVQREDIIRLKEKDGKNGSLLTLDGNNYILTKLPSALNYEDEIVTSIQPRPSTLAFIWERVPGAISPLDNILRRAPYESGLFGVLVGISVWSYLGMGASILFVVAVPVLAFVAGLSHYWGTYGMEGGVLTEFYKTPSFDKAMIWLVWTLAFAGGLLLLGQGVPSEYLNAVLALVSAAGARVSFLVHRKENRDWVVKNLPDLTPAQRLVARDILIALEGKPIRMGVGDLQDLVYQMAEKNAASEAGFGIDLGADSTAGDGVTFFVVDPVISEKPGNPDRLKKMLSTNPHLIGILAQPVEGLPQDQVIVFPSSFVKNGVGFDVMVGGLRQSILGMAGDRPFQMMTSPLLTLNTIGMAKDDPVRKASEDARVFLLELLRGFSAKEFRWPDVMKAFRALAEAA